MNVETKKVKNAFQDKLRRDGEKLRGEKKMFIAADKTKNLYKMDKDTHENLRKKHRKNCECCPVSLLIVR